MQRSKQGMWKGQRKVYKRDTFSAKNGIEKGKGLNFGAEPPPPYKTLLRTPRVAGSTCAHDFVCNNYRLSSAEFSSPNVTN